LAKICLIIRLFPLIRWETEPRRVETRHALSLLPDAKPKNTRKNLPLSEGGFSRG